MKLLNRTSCVLFAAMIISLAALSCNREKSLPRAAAPASNIPPMPEFTVQDGDTIWYKVDYMPVFPGGDKALLQYLADNTRYPESAKASGIQGRSLVSFIITETGSVGKVRIAESSHPDFDAEAIRVVKSLPMFEKPAMRNGREVPVVYMVPISFRMK